MDKIVSVIIVDDHPLVLNGFEFILQDTSEICLKGSFTRAGDALTFLVKETVDVVLMDINMPDLNGIEATEIIKKYHPSTRIIAISNLNEESVATRMLQSGASGYLLKNVSASELINAIKAVDSGQQVLSREMDNVLAETQQQVPFVTRREREVLTLLAQGRTTPEIADEMFISPLTVESHRRNLLQKFKVTNAASLIHKAMEMKFI